MFQPQEYQRKLNLAYEIEGLLHLIMDRGDQAPADVVALLGRKIDELARSQPPAQEVAQSQLFERESMAGEAAKQQAPTEAAAEVPPKPLLGALSVADSEHHERELMARAQPEPEPDAAPAPPSAPTPRAKAQPHFTINDTYRFKRELFRNSNEEWQEALDVIAAMGSYEEAEDYFYNDMAWDPDSDDVKAFMEVVRQALEP